MRSTAARSRPKRGEGVFVGLAGLWLALALIKLGNPVIFDDQVPAPSNGLELLVGAWPISWGYALTGIVLVAGLRWIRWPHAASGWLLAAPLVWLGWQVLASLHTIDPAATEATLKHFATCVAAFYLGAFVLGPLDRLRPFWIGLVGGFLVVLAVAWRQRLGGLEETRSFFFDLPDWRAYPPEFIEKICSDRVYGTLFYPNALAGAIVLLLPVSLGIVWDGAGKLQGFPRWLAVAPIAGLALAALYWSGSKGGWLIALAQGLTALLLAKVPLRAKAVVIGLILMVGLGAFWARYHGYFARGATSVSARIDYWTVAWHTLREKPWFGSGPGAFGAVYKAEKAPEAEMARLAHNDYLQQGADSGWIGMVAFTSWLFGGLIGLYRKSKIGSDLTRFGVWLGIAGLIVQAFVEFWLYIPGSAWPAFSLLGWLAGNRIDKEDPLT